MHATSPSLPSPPPEEFHLVVHHRPDDAQHPWLATLREPGATHRFETPFELMRHLALRLTAPRRGGGLR